MKKTVFAVSVLAACFVVSSACANRSGREGDAQNNESVSSTSVPGSDQDGHGCVAAAGYTWSELSQDCIRPLEKGLEFIPVGEVVPVYAAYLVFNGDSSKVEVFLPGKGGRPVLTRTEHLGHESIWNSIIPETPVVRQDAEDWTISIDDEVLYTR